MFTWGASEEEDAARDERFRCDLQRTVLRAYGLKPWDAGLAPVPWRVRIWRAVTFARRRGTAIDWRSYNAAEAQARAAKEAYETALPGLMQATAGALPGRPGTRG